MIPLVSIRFERRGGAIDPVANARTAWVDRQGFWLRIEDADGVVGWGEASPLPGYSPDTLAETEQDLQRVASACRAVPNGAGQLAHMAEGLNLGPAARFAIETAWLDLLGRRLGRPAWRVLGAKNRASVPVAALVTERDPERAVAQAEGFVAQGLSALKFKIGRPGAWAQELEVLKALRAAFPDIPQRLDANRAFKPSEWRVKAPSLARFEPEFVEEPIATDELIEWTRQDGGAGLQSLGVLLALDESLQRPEIVERLRPLLETGAVRAFVLKPMALGGFHRCLALASQAQAFGAGSLVTHLFDGPIGFAAACALALALPGERLAAGLARHAALAAWPTVPLPISTPGWVDAWPAPGLGLEIGT